MKKSKLIKDILSGLEKGLIITLVWVSRGSLYQKDRLLSRTLAELAPDTMQSASKRALGKRALKRLLLQRSVEFTRVRDKVILQLTEKGKKRLLSYKLDEIFLESSQPWDGLWRIVMFDIPEDIKSFRDVFRQNHLIKMGFVQIQRSVFITPFPCRDQIDFIAELFGLRSCIRVIEAISLDGDESIRRYFNLGK